ncbi:hypothetical protein A2334_00285 [Candidatus Roizmanbacteria bacterium RIFOXYB2_FULL_38_10]|uniref:D-isomer specific 2-hydroxyacid dehydrogenase NAD-binding domain-containing protein n=1 Tax=Candidatus Roizmanbacteria bacterium RIFOXYD1_FULL_38_12 TaxID=1802093 RepID=A0A1F7L2J4_9BACT|nr:MAG: hypothetical protein A3K47_05830 [Candidatus Roizmanbacteria bacterium RIFOXYA2_FULL_38_14]OGK64261.1 MAG: hypothetical protein A3K27_05830 [Candidatus Roizmanbacteria bacterium RIFOXYA1_FULL_37_12]OGK66107.1 MAG: hypothetical protein A3K38_05830 [Candidatus Roizmanbacteria bacterium RIFOXYB1_FULL_40_23]OGK67672.1 MAG: hypothetical protein A2334_00285 [Candidatus Roizmanbacteria bacterium RIFOXYB2_FULL_38_10]OGK70512.1 MAG: hypothetical protein A3K21_05835 [Candidatus Roizmanbacteria ba
MNIVCLASDPAIDAYLKPLHNSHNLTIYHVQNLSPKEVIEKVADAEVLITGPEVTILRRELLLKLPSLKLLSVLTIGTDWLDLDYCREKGIVVSNIHGATAESVAEHTWAMILNLAKRVNEFDREARLNSAYNFSLYKGKEIYGKTLGVLGLGSIGSQVVRIAKCFNMRILGINKSQKPMLGVELVDKITLLKESDVITICIPLNSKTENYISSEEIELVKHGVIIVNCAREKIVNKMALLEGIKSGKIFGYGVETPIMQVIDQNDEYYKYPNIIVVPHNAFNTEDADAKTYNLVVENIEAFNIGKPQNVV